MVESLVICFVTSSMKKLCAAVVHMAKADPTAVRGPIFCIRGEDNFSRPALNGIQVILLAVNAHPAAQ